WRLSNPIAHDTGGAAPTLKGSYVATPPYHVTPPSDQPSCNACVDSNDLRIPGTTVVRNGSVYGAWGTAIDNGAHIVPGIEWAQIRLDSVAEEDAATTGYYNFKGDTSASYPTLMPDAEGNILMVFDLMSSTVFPQARYIVKPADESNFRGAGQLLKAGEGSYRPSLCGGPLIPVCRWGDFEAASWDGGNHIWFASQYANTLQTGPPQNGRNWGTWIGAISAS
ncbi:MAG TPA: hypothetical protein VEU76_10700, partial [Candidatus Udaeobacter sp.]|nr:hypothetical protein [Candidatus Udaeobacter sp.]